MSGSFEFTIHQAVWLFPACIAVHFLEEAFGFARWARSYISPRYTDAHWRRSSWSGVGVCACRLRGRVAVDTTGPDIPVYCPIPDADGVQFAISSRYVGILPPLLPRDYFGTGALSRRLLARGVDLFACGSFERGGVLAATVIGAAFHTIDLASTTFFLHRKPPR